MHGSAVSSQIVLLSQLWSLQNPLVEMWSTLKRYRLGETAVLSYQSRGKFTYYRPSPSWMFCPARGFLWMRLNTVLNVGYFFLTTPTWNINFTCVAQQKVMSKYMKQHIRRCYYSSAILIDFTRITSMSWPWLLSSRTCRSADTATWKTKRGR